VWALLGAQDQASGEFRQELFDEDGELVELTRGRYAILRPGFFRWEIEDPDRQRITVADGVLWHYDIDLATATSRKVDADEQFTALDLLARDSEDLAARFAVEVIGAGSYRLLPLFPRAGFSAVELSWQGDVLTSMTVERRGGQTLSLDLSPTDAPVELSPADFVFVVPDGVEVQRANGS
jgi:chaperone LolA